MTKLSKYLLCNTEAVCVHRPDTHTDTQTQTFTYEYYTLYKHKNYTHP